MDKPNICVPTWEEYQETESNLSFEYLAKLQEAMISEARRLQDEGKDGTAKYNQYVDAVVEYYTGGKDEKVFDRMVELMGDLLDADSRRFVTVREETEALACFTLFMYELGNTCVFNEIE